MKKTLTLLLATLVSQVIATSTCPFSPPDDEKVLTTTLPALVKPAHLRFLDDCIPAAFTTPRSTVKAQELTRRIDMYYGIRLRENLRFFRLLKPLIVVTPGCDDHHTSLVMSDFRIECLRMYVEKINPPIFTYEGALNLLDMHEGEDRYKLFMLQFSSIPQSQVAFARIVWAKLSTISHEQLEVSHMVLGFLNQNPSLWEQHVSTVFYSMFQRDNWDKKYWGSFIKSCEHRELLERLFREGI